ncbi:MAG: glycosyltransferase family 2 protein [Halolamina sp.]
MYRGQTVAVVIPAHDEAAFVGDVVAATPGFVDRLFVVDDASSDDTTAVALAAADPETEATDGFDASDCSLGERVAETGRRGRVVLLRHGENRGPGGAVVTGYLAALAGDADVVATIDGDGQMAPDELGRFLDPLVDGDADYAKGTRLRRREDAAEMPRFRQFGNGLLTQLCRLSSGYHSLTDPVNGYTAITREALTAIDPASVYEGYGYGTQLLGRLHADGRRLVDVPHASQYGEEESGIDVRRYAVRVSALLLRTFAWRLATEWLGSHDDEAPWVADRVAPDRAPAPWGWEP